jgi:hypothetical protein
MLPSEPAQRIFQFTIFFERDDLPTRPARRMVMMVPKPIAKFNFIFPPSIQASNDTELFEKCDRSVYAGSIDASATFYELAHHKWFAFV